MWRFLTFTTTSDYAAEHKPVSGEHSLGHGHATDAGKQVATTRDHGPCDNRLTSDN